MIAMRPGRFVSRLFYSELRILGENTGNLFGYLYRDAAEPFWRFEWRFRYYEDDDTSIKSKDRKTFFEGHFRPDQGLPEIMPTVKHIFTIAGAGSFEEIIIESSNPDLVLKRIKEQKWAHVTYERRDAR